VEVCLGVGGGVGVWVYVQESWQCHYPRECQPVT
jgi:hypothetical protein